MISRSSQTTTSKIEFEPYNNDKYKKKKRFKSPMRNIFKSITTTTTKTDDAYAPYLRLEEKEVQYTDLQFKESPAKIPIYAIILATILFLLGSAMITLGSLILTGYIETKYDDRSWPLLLIGTLLFLPGFYHVRIAYWAWKGDKNFSFADIPDLDWF